MGLLEIVILAAVQGITEFLPISSSGHLRLAAELLGITGSTLAIDVAVHVGTLGAVIIYFSRDLWRIACGMGQMLTGTVTQSGQLGLFIVLATLPVIAVGYIGRDFIDLELRTLEVFGWATMVFAVLLWAADRVGATALRLENLNASNALIIGVAQVIALVPGTSRAGITISAARVLGFERTEAARFSMLLSIPTITGAGVLILSDLAASGDAELGRSALVAGAFSFITALVAIALFMRWLRFAGFGPFIIYRLLLGAGMLYVVYFTSVG